MPFEQILIILPAHLRVAGLSAQPRTKWSCPAAQECTCLDFAALILPIASDGPLPLTMPRTAWSWQSHSCLRWQVGRLPDRHEQKDGGLASDEGVAERFLALDTGSGRSPHMALIIWIYRGHAAVRSWRQLASQLLTCGVYEAVVCV